jgi:hypothetical protein
MLMTKPELTEKARDLLEVIRLWRGEWVTRAQIAEVEGKKRLNVWDVKLLDDLATAELIEARKVKIKSPIGYEWQYRAKG